MPFLAEMYIFVLAVLAGFQVIAKVPSILHTPLMSATNAIHGIILMAALIVVFSAHRPSVFWLALVAVLFATINLVGGFVVTDRILGLFRTDRGGQDG